MAKKKSSRTDSGFLNRGIKQPRGPDYVVVELRYGSRVAYSAAALPARLSLRRRPTV